MRRGAVAVALLLAALPAAAGSEDDFGDGRVVFAREGALWTTDPKGKGPPVELMKLPDGAAAADVRMIRTDPAGTVLLIDVGGAWWWSRITDGVAGAPARLDCADAPARLTEDGRVVLCADGDGQALVISLVTGRQGTRPVPAGGARLVVHDGARDLIWADADGVWAAPLTAVREAEARRELAPDPPLRGFLPSPDGTRAVATYLGEVFVKRKEKVEAEVLTSFALDGTAARRQLFQDAVVIDWSWDSQWLLVQEGERACITRPTGGEYKCWKRYQAVSISPDGRWALVLGKRKDGEEGERSLYRARLEGQHTERPSLVETVIEGGGALWLPGSAAAPIE